MAQTSETPVSRDACRGALRAAYSRATVEPPHHPDSRPAPPSSEKLPSGIRWTRILAVGLIVAAGAGAYAFNEWRKTEALRAEILRAYERTVRAYHGPIARLDAKILAKVKQAGGRWAGDFRD